LLTADAYQLADGDSVIKDLKGKIDDMGAMQLKLECVKKA